MLGTASDTPGAVFFDPSGRRQRAVAAVLLALVCAAAGAAALLIIGLTGAPPPRALLGRGTIVGGDPARAVRPRGAHQYPAAQPPPAHARSARRHPAHVPRVHRTANTPPPLPTLPAP
jgi:hypothetical protein